MIADLQTIEQQLKNNETIKGTIRCSLEVFIYRKIVRPVSLQQLKND
ncbi:hypothetical protein [Niallia circulans]|uniref:Uncharacterized protein n=1 Tax=Niallia circulans TaxID=1397 RepID=A0A941GJD4_NIACI|nr:hypothetical protein [Niallia circulans]MCB5239094.1 hypothetical protein [Niallia circulans]